jgi:hypothetical protein
MSFLIQGCSLLKAIPTKFPSALATVYKWLSERDEKIAPAITEEYKIFFANYKGHNAQKRQDKRDHVEELRTLFKFCRKLTASVGWVEQLSEPDLLMGEKAILMGCTTPLRMLFECKHHYSHEYFKLIDYVMDQSKLAGPSTGGFVQFIKVTTVQIDKPWTELF